jgi:hypothetical protein
LGHATRTMTLADATLSTNGVGILIYRPSGPGGLSTPRYAARSAGSAATRSETTA